ncbi:hypothetical protein TSUD_164820 [Trifolium subterraneum]|uniref:Secreted protein n=1 Tax=Trifolium subterraneum TaxID=3900 RepID=A0A2Z6MXS7_TRISU|nr:hypothetical protein TSUD_164820 [Trifolium subterraneum]
MCHCQQPWARMCLMALQRGVSAICDGFFPGYGSFISFRFQGMGEYVPPVQTSFGAWVDMSSSVLPDLVFVHWFHILFF